nr:cysteine--tRNA ligase [Arthrobacter roseus]
MRFYDTVTAQVRDFVPLVPGQVSLYYCGATVQGDPHVGHLRSAIAFDQLTRWLEARDHRVTVVRNVTDIDDKILLKSAESFSDAPPPGAVVREPWWALAYRFEQVFLSAYDVLGVRRPTYEPRATGHIPEMHALISALIERGHAYPGTDASGDVYFDVRSWDAYGSLTHQDIDEMQAATDADPRGKRDPRDFALWKGHKEGEPESAAWDSPWGRGRPGWHLECSAMAAKYLGSRFDIHGGGLDLRFPHHENELAQSTAAGQDFANFWMHNGMVTFQGDKMSKSLGNGVGPDELLAKASPRVVRYYLGQAHYRSVLDYRPSSLEEAAAAVARIDGFIAKASVRVTGAEGRIPEQFALAMDDDLNIPQALAALHQSVRAGNTALASGDTTVVDRALGEVLAMTEVLGLDDAGVADGAGGPELKALGTLVQGQLDLRAEAKSSKDWARADAIRDALAVAGITIEDSSDGSTWNLNPR